mgnify:CR=1 FL=1
MICKGFFSIVSPYDGANVQFDIGFLLIMDDGIGLTDLDAGLAITAWSTGQAALRFRHGRLFVQRLLDFFVPRSLGRRQPVRLGPAPQRREVEDVAIREALLGNL